MKTNDPKLDDRFDFFDSFDAAVSECPYCWNDIATPVKRNITGSRGGYVGMVFCSKECGANYQKQGA